MPPPTAAALGVDVAFGVVGGLALFLYGMQRVTTAFEMLAGRGMARRLGRLTSNRFSALATGVVMTSIVQSSSITTVMLVGLVSSGVLTLAQSVGVVFGANVGTTLTAQLIAFPVEQVALLFVALGFAVSFASRNGLHERIGQSVLGLGLLFLGMSVMGEAMRPLRESSVFRDVVAGTSNPFVGIAAGLVFTAVVQSSTATTGLLIAMAAQGLIGLEAATAVVVGANVGTCGTAWLATIGRPPAARRVAWVHLLFNLTGLALWAPFLGLLGELARSLDPDSLPRQIAHVHTAFSVSVALFLLPFTRTMTAIASRLAPEPAAPPGPPSTTALLDRAYFATPSIALQQARREIVRMAVPVRAMLAETVPATASGSARLHQAWTAHEIGPRRMHEQIVAYLADLSRRVLAARDADALAALMHAANDLENVIDTLAVGVALIGRERRERGLEFNAETMGLFAQLVEHLATLLDETAAALDSLDLARAERVVASKEETYERADSIGRRLLQRLIADAPERLATYRLESDLLDHLRRVSWSIRRVASIVVEHHAALTP